MNKNIISLTILASILAVFPLASFGATKVVNCKNDVNCFIKNAKTCTPAKMSTSFTIQPPTKDYEIKGKKNGLCVLYEKPTKYGGDDFFESIKVREDFTQAQLQDISYSPTTCLFKTSDLVWVLKKWQSKLFSEHYYDKAKCSGGVFKYKNFY